MPLYAVLAREYFGPRIMGTLFGAATMVSTLGMAFGPIAGGLIFDSFNSYAWLYIGSFERWARRRCHRAGVPAAAGAGKQHPAAGLMC